MDWTWIVMIVVLAMILLPPLLRQKLLDAARKRFIALIEKKRDSRVILLIHRQESFRLLGLPLMRYIDMNDSEEVLRAIHMTDDQVPLDIVLHTPGGLVVASVQIARAIHRHPGKVTVHVPHMAMSGGTLIALAADEICMSPHAVLGPVDPVVGQYPGASILRTVETKPVDELDDRTLILGDQARKAASQLKAAVRNMLDDKIPAEKAEELADLLAGGTWTHDHPIDLDTARGFGLPVSEEVPEEIFKMMALYPQPVRRQQGVEYIPTPHHDSGREA